MVVEPGRLRFELGACVSDCLFQQIRRSLLCPAANPKPPLHGHTDPLALRQRPAFAQPDTMRVVYYPPWNISKLPLYLARDSRHF